MTKAKQDTADTRYLDTDSLVFERTEGGFLSLRIGRKKPYQRINVYRSFPLTSRREYISIRDGEDHEIGIIMSLDDLPVDTARLLDEELDRRYFAPVIEKIVSLKEEFGYIYWDVVSDAGSCRFTVKGGENNVSLLSGDTLLIIDVDGNRFEFPDYENRADSKSLKLIETML